MIKPGRVWAGVLGCFLLIEAQAGPLDSLSQHLARGVNSLKNKKVAVLTFPYHDGKISSGSSIVSERLTTLLVGKKDIRVIERRLIQQLLSEKKLNETGMIDPESLKAMGSVLNVDAIVTGTLIDMENGQTEINARMILADSGEVLAAGQETIARTWNDAPVAPRVQRSSSNPSKSAVANKDRTKSEKRNNAVASPKSQGGKSLRLSNESFAPGRRRYLSGNKAPAKRGKNTSAASDQNSAQPAYDSGYDEGYYDARRESVENNNTNSSKNRSDAESIFMPTIQHPTQVGKVRTESE